MADSSDVEGARPERGRRVPALPPKLADPTPVALAGTLLWVAGFLVLLGVQLTGHGSPAVTSWMWTCVAGLILGAFGYSVFLWQRSSSRRGARGAWRGFESS